MGDSGPRHPRPEGVVEGLKGHLQTYIFYGEWSEPKLMIAGT